MREQFANWRVQVPLVACLLLVALLAFLVFRYFLLTFTVAGSLALILAPVQRRLTRKLGGYKSAAAGLLVLGCTVVLLLPLIFFGVMLTQQAMAAFEWLRPHLEPAALEKLWRETLPARYPFLMAWVRESSGGTAVPAASEALGRLTTAVNGFLQLALVHLVTGLMDMIVFMMMLFFLLRDGAQLRDVLRGVSPLTRGQETEIIDHLSKTVKGVLLSMVIVPVAQGVVALVGFWLFGVPSPVLLSVFVFFAAMIHLIGTPLVWIPTGLYLFFWASPAKGIGMLLYGALVISTMDNIIKPIILKGAAQIHALLAFLSVLGGLYAFGAKGLIAGPVILSLVLSAYRIYRYDILRWRHEEEEPVVPALSDATLREPTPALRSR
ncbi:MAG TPA: AI-2E family transporter [Vicinamibacteria bacterium]